MIKFSTKLILISLLSLASHAGQLHILAKLYPAGSLEIESKEVMGHLVKQGDKITAKKIFLMINSLDSGVDLRNQHIHQYFQEKKYKKFTLSDVEIQKGIGSGFLSINGIKKKVKFKVERKEKDYVSSFKVNRKAFKLPKAEFMGISVDDVVSLTVKFPIKRVVRGKK